MKDSSVTFTHMFTSVWGIIATIFAILGFGIGILSYVNRTYPTILDMLEKIDIVQKSVVPKPEYYKKTVDTDEKIIKLTENMLKADSQMKKELAQEISKLRVEYRTERLHDLVQQLKLIDEKLLIHTDDVSLKNFRIVLCKEYDRVRGKLDNGLKELD